MSCKSTGHPPYPGVLFQMGHTSNGKAGDTYQRCCQGLARLGYLVLAFDPMGQGSERIYYPDSSGIRSRLESADSEHTVPGKQMLLNGDTATRLQLWDAVRSLDVLASHPLADARRLAFTGQSGGATLTMLLAAVDDRLAAAVVCSGNTENVACANFNPPGATDDAEQNLIGSGPAGFDRWDLLYPLAPKPLLISVSDMDFFHTYSPEYIRNGWEEFKKLRAVYATLGAGRPAGVGGYTAAARSGLRFSASGAGLQMVCAMAEGGDCAGDARTRDGTGEKDETLWASASGSMLRSYHGETPFTLNRARQVMVRPMPLGDLVGAERPPAGLKPAVLRRVVWRDVTVEALEVGSAPRVWLPGWLYLPAVPGAAKQTLLLLDAAGRDQRWQEGGLYHALAQRGYAVCAADVRGVGDLAPEIGRRPRPPMRGRACG